MRDALEMLGLCPKEINQGNVVLTGKPDKGILSELDVVVRKMGMVLLTDPSHIMTDNVKLHAWNYIHFPDDPVMKFSVYLERKMGYRYNYLSNVFSMTEGVSITTFLNRLKIVAVKKLIANGHTFSEIANKLNYSNLSHLSYVFKKATGQTLSQYKSCLTE